MRFFETLTRLDQEAFLNWLFLILTGIIVWYGVRHRDADGKSDFMRLLFGVVAAMFFLLALFQDVIGFFLQP